MSLNIFLVQKQYPDTAIKKKHKPLFKLTYPGEKLKYSKSLCPNDGGCLSFSAAL